MNNIPENFWKVLMGAFGLLILFLAVLSVKELKSIGYVGRSLDMTNMISVDGKGEAVSIPDVATFSFSVNETAKTVTEAQTKATQKIDDALKAVKAGGVGEKDIKTLSYNINPHYEYDEVACTQFRCPPSKQVLTGYDVSETIEVKVRDINKAGELFSSIAGTGVTNINGLTFSVDDPEKIIAEARSKAIANAQEKAKILAKQLGVRLVRISSFYDQGTGGRPYAYGMGGGDFSAKELSVTAAPAPSVLPGENKITDTVSISYIIE